MPQTLYTFNELSDEVQQMLFDTYVEMIDNDTEWTDELIYEIETELQDDYGGYGIEIRYTGFYSQGDGACFTGELDIKEWIEAVGESDKYPLILYLLDNDDLYSTTVDVYSIDSHHTHANSIAVGEIDYRGSAGIEKYLEPEQKALQESMQEWAREYSKEIFSRLKTLYETLTDFDYFHEQEAGNGRAYDIDGNIEYTF